MPSVWNIQYPISHIIPNPLASIFGVTSVATEPLVTTTTLPLREAVRELHWRVQNDPSDEGAKRELRELNQKMVQAYGSRTWRRYVDRALRNRPRGQKRAYDYSGLPRPPATAFQTTE